MIPGAPRTAAGEDLGDLIVEGVEAESLKGLTVAEIADQQGKHIVDAMLDLAMAYNLDATFVTPSQQTDLAATKEIATAPYAIPGVSDRGDTKFGTLGAYPTEFLTKLVRDGRIMELEEAHWRLSAHPARPPASATAGALRKEARRISSSLTTNASRCSVQKKPSIFRRVNGAAFAALTATAGRS